MNPISAISWLWKALRGHSVTFAILLAFAILGFSVLRWVKLGLDAMGTPWLLVFILPTLLIGLLSKKERVWIPEEARRKFWARGILGAAVLLAAAMAVLKPTPTKPVAVSPSKNAVDGGNGLSVEPRQKPNRPHGPSGK